MSLEIIGAGFGRTGTMSLKAALEQLGFTKCHHMQEVALHAEQLDYWYAVSKGEPVDWDQVFAGYRASCDFPSSALWERLYEHFPGSKVILTTRDPDRWYSSTAETIYPISMGVPGWLKFLSSRLRRGHEMVDRIVWGGLFGGRFEDKEHALEVFHRHVDRVREVVADDRLLVFRATDGWEPLCRFLDVPVPDGPFPHLNEGASLKRVRRLLVLVRWSPLLLLTAIAAGLWLL
jgi:hypothetical protein